MDGSNINLILAGLFVLLLLVFGIFYAAFNLMSTPNQKMQSRLHKMSSRFGQNPKDSKEGDEQAQSIALNVEGSALDQLVKDFLPRPIELKNRLAQAGLSMGVGKYSIISLVTGLISVFIMSIIVGFPFVLSLLIGVFLGLFLPHFTISRMIKKRKTAFIGLFPDAIDLIVRGLQSGLPVSDNIASVGREIPDPVGIEFTRIADNMRLGKPMDEAMWETAERLDTPDFKFFVISLSVQKETGGNLAETLSNLSTILRKRQNLKLKIRAMSSEGRASAMIVGLLPFIMLGLLMFINYDYASILFTDPRAIIVSIVGLAWMGLGVFIMSKMINFEI